VQGVCSCFSLFNLQGALRILRGRSLSGELIYYITEFRACQELFSKFFESLYFVVTRSPKKAY
ncbi:MAG: hypothetical protein ACLSCX_10050, partial [Oscillospiraceae bacterium]